MRKLILWLTVSLLLLSGCAKPTPPPAAPTSVPTSTPTEEAEAPATPTVTPPAVLNEEVVEEYFELTSAAFAEGEVIPMRYTCHGEDVSPPLAWGSPPEGTASLVLLMEDPDAQQVVGFTWIHWLLYDLPADLGGLEEGETAGQEGTNSWGNLGYGGPCPPAGQLHHYIFTLYALDAPPNLPPGSEAEAVKAAMEGHVIATTQLTGIYGSP